MRRRRLRGRKDLGSERGRGGGGRGREGAERGAVTNPLAVILMEERPESAPPAHVARTPLRLVRPGPAGAASAREDGGGQRVAAPAPAGEGLAAAEVRHRGRGGTT
jgi:hypothetical protein